MTVESNPTGTESVPTRWVQKVSGLEFTAVLYLTHVKSRCIHSILLSRQVWEFSPTPDAVSATQRREESSKQKNDHTIMLPDCCTTSRFSFTVKL